MLPFHQGKRPDAPPSAQSHFSVPLDEAKWVRPQKPLPSTICGKTHKPALAMSQCHHGTSRNLKRPDAVTAGVGCVIVASTKPAPPARQVSLSSSSGPGI